MNSFRYTNKIIRLSFFYINNHTLYSFRFSIIDPNKQLFEKVVYRHMSSIDLLGIRPDLYIHPKNIPFNLNEYVVDVRTILTTYKNVGKLPYGCTRLNVE